MQHRYRLIASRHVDSARAQHAVKPSEVTRRQHESKYAPIVRPLLLAMVGSLVAISSCPSSFAAKIQVGISSLETYVGRPVVLQIQIENGKDVNAPDVPTVDGLKVEYGGSPRVAQQTIIINGRRSVTSSQTFEYLITPLRAGEFTLPSFKVTADGDSQTVEPLTIRAQTSETGDLLFVEVSGTKSEIYVGEALDVTLRIWIKPFRSEQHQITLSESNTWQTISERSNWGKFTDSMIELQQRNRRPSGQEARRPDADGQSTNYFVYDVATTIYPERPGRIEMQDVQIIVDYPVSLGRSRRSFGGGLFDDDFFAPFGRSRLSVTATRPISAGAEVPAIQVKPIPTTGRPDDYRGAVGQYDLVTEAKPTRVTAGDPITLHLGIKGTGPMDRVEAPPLADVHALTTDFRVPTEPLAGFVEGDQKVFSTTIRPIHEGITEIPAIPFSYFDPDREEFITAYSEPIPISVAVADTLDMSSIVATQRPRDFSDETSQDASQQEQNVTALPYPENLPPNANLTNEMPVANQVSVIAAFIGIPPLMVLFLQLYRVRDSAMTVAGRLRSAKRELQSRLPRSNRRGQLADVIRGFLLRTQGLPESADVDAAIGQLRQTGRSDLANEFERLLWKCTRSEAAESVLESTTALDPLKNEIIKLAEDTEAFYSKKRKQPQVVSTRAAESVKVILVIAFAGAMPLISHAAIDVQLSASQRQILLDEADSAYARGQMEANAVVRLANFKEAAEKYQTVVDSGMMNSRLFTNLGNALFAISNVSLASTAFERALKLDPTNRAARENLAYIQRIHGAEAEVTTTSTATEYQAGRIWIGLRNVNQWINRYVHPRTALRIAIVSWAAMWATIGFRILGWRFPWKLTTLALLTLMTVAASSYAVSHMTWLHT